MNFTKEQLEKIKEEFKDEPLIFRDERVIELIQDIEELQRISDTPILSDGDEDHHAPKLEYVIIMLRAQSKRGSISDSLIPIRMTKTEAIEYLNAVR